VTRAEREVRDQRIVARLLASGGESLSAIARDEGLTRQRVSQILRRAGLPYAENRTAALVQRLRGPLDPAFETAHTWGEVAKAFGVTPYAMRTALALLGSGDRETREHLERLTRRLLMNQRRAARSHQRQSRRIAREEDVLAVRLLAQRLGRSPTWAEIAAARGASMVGICHRWTGRSRVWYSNALTRLFRLAGVSRRTAERRAA
jgi:transcriptional regulator with XRE-family HTH domain